MRSIWVPVLGPSFGSQLGQVTEVVSSVRVHVESCQLSELKFAVQEEYQAQLITKDKQLRPGEQTSELDARERLYA